MSALLAGAMLAPAAARASVLVLPNADSTSPVGIGRPQWTQMTADLSAAAGSPLITSTAALDDPAALQACTGLWVDLGQSSESLTSAETSNLQAFIQSGRRVVLIGENSYYGTWDGSILSAVGGAYANGNFNGATPARSYTVLTTGVASLNVTQAGTAASSSVSTSLFQDRVATTWGPAQNALVMLDTEALADPALSAAGNSAFASNVATWVAGGFGTTTNWKIVARRQLDHGRQLVGRADAQRRRHGRVQPRPQRRGRCGLHRDSAELEVRFEPHRASRSCHAGFDCRAGGAAGAAGDVRHAAGITGRNAHPHACVGKRGSGRAGGSGFGGRRIGVDGRARRFPPA